MSTQDPAQVVLLSKGKPDDPCGRCGCERKHHCPPSSITDSKTGSSSGKAKKKLILARTCCFSCPFCICFCTGFVEPFIGQPYRGCSLKPKKAAVIVGGEIDDDEDRPE